MKPEAQIAPPATVRFHSAPDFGAELLSAMEPYGAIEEVARNSYSRLLAFLASRSRDVAAAEDALAEAFRSALETWPRTGAPTKPEAWLLVAARRKLADAARHARVHSDALPHLLKAAGEAQELLGTAAQFPDERLKLLFICSHPAIDAPIRTPLMLQTILGLDASRIAAAFLIRPTAMGQRLARAKAKIRDAGIRFEVPDESELPARLDAVLQAIYAAYGSGWDEMPFLGSDGQDNDFSSEAIYLGRILAHLLPGEPEAQGLLALMLYCEARRNARRSATGDYVPLSEQDPARWSHDLIAEAELHLKEASKKGRMGRFQLEAAIQSAHSQRARTGHTPWEAIALLYEGLVRLAPTTGALTGRAAAVAEAQGAEAGWALLSLIPRDRVESYQPYWALAAHLLMRMGRQPEAAEAYARAMSLCRDPAARDFLARQSRFRSAENS